MKKTSFTIPVTCNGNTTNHDLIEKYGELSIGNVTVYAHNTWTTTAALNRQNLFMMFKLLKETLTTEALAVIQNISFEYHIDGHHDGPSLFRVIISKAHIATRATGTVIHMHLYSLDTYMEISNWNIYTFNKYVQGQVRCMEYRRETTQCPMFNLFKAYSMVSDKIIVTTSPNIIITTITARKSQHKVSC